jgi:hypothetical protein
MANRARQTDGAFSMILQRRRASTLSVVVTLVVMLVAARVLAGVTYLWLAPGPPKLETIPVIGWLMPPPEVLGALFARYGIAAALAIFVTALIGPLRNANYRAVRVAVGAVGFLYALGPISYLLVLNAVGWDVVEAAAPSFLVVAIITTIGIAAGLWLGLRLARRVLRFAGPSNGVRTTG